MRVGWALLVAGCSFEGGNPAATVDGGIDSALADPVDAEATWGPGMCPPSYDVIAGEQTSRYRIDPRGMSVWAHGDSCAGDLPGRTHLAVPDDMPEVVALQAVLDAESGLPTRSGFTLVWIGGVQLRGQTTPGAGWRVATGGSLLATAWESPEPNDWGETTYTNNYEDNEEQFAVLWRGQQHLGDLVGSAQLAAFCECDGRPVDPQVQAEIDATRP